MINELLNRFQKALQKNTFELKLKETDLPLLEALFRLKKAKQYSLEKELRQRHVKMPHSTVTGKLERLINYGLVKAEREKDGFTYYSLTPFGLAVLLEKGKIDFSQALSHFEQNQKEYFETLVALQPNLIERLAKQPAWFVTQLTQDLWVIYYIANREELRRQTLNFLIGKREEFVTKPAEFKLQFLCSQKIEVEGKGICLKERKQCVFKSNQLADCPIIRKQIETEIEKLEK
jgi:predicted transcriptional regulator